MSGIDDNLPSIHPLCTLKSQCICIYLWHWNKRNPVSCILLCTKLYSGACLGLLGMRIQHAVYVYWILHLNSCCEIISQCAWGWGNGAREKELPPLPCSSSICSSHAVQYLLIPKIRTPWNWGSLGIRTLIREMVLIMKCIRSYFV